jgi:hypothetical protein
VVLGINSSNFFFEGMTKHGNLQHHFAWSPNAKVNKKKRHQPDLHGPDRRTSSHGSCERPVHPSAIYNYSDSLFLNYYYFVGKYVPNSYMRIIHFLPSMEL